MHIQDHGASEPAVPTLPQLDLDLHQGRLQITCQCQSLEENVGSINGWLFLEGGTLWCC